MKSKKIKGVIEVLIVIALFIGFSYLIQTNLDFFESIIGSGILGMLIYIFIEIIAIVVAPVTTLPLITVPSNLWGWVIAAILSIIGWTIGSVIAFVIARKYGVNIVKKFIPLKEINKLEKRVPHEHLFLSVVFLRMIIPIDILSYVLGLFSKMKLRTYALATFIGIMPFAFILAYLGGLPVQYQVIAFLLGVTIFGIVYLIKRKNKK